MRRLPHQQPVTGGLSDLRWLCRICDPLVGTGQRPNVCLTYCDGFYSACADEYFAFHPTSGMPLIAIGTTCHRLAKHTGATGVRACSVQSCAGS
jgi:hypothetical protein